MKLTRAEREQIAENCQRAKRRGQFGAAFVADTAAATGVSEGYVYRLARDGVPPLRRQSWQLTNRAIDLYYQHRRVARVCELLAVEDPLSPSARQIYRAFREQLGSDELAFIRWGAVKRRARSGCVRWEARARNAVWQTDHVQLGVPVLLPGHQRPKKLWMTYFIDCWSRMVMGWVISVRESSDAVLEALRDAILIDEEIGKLHGGVPRVVMFDNGATFLAKVIGEAAGMLDFRCRPVEPYSPHRNGKVERCHQTISGLALSEIPSWKHGPRDKSGRLYSKQALTEEQLIRMIAKTVQSYNFERSHAALRGDTPAERFFSGREALRRETPERLRFALRHRKKQKVQTSGVFKHGRYYRCEWTDTHVGDQVWVAWLRKDERHVDLYDLDRKFIGTARPHEELKREEVVALKQAERARHAEQDRKLRQAMSASEEKYSPTNDPAGLNVVTVPIRPAVPAAPSEDTQLALLEALGLADAVGKPWSPSTK